MTKIFCESTNDTLKLLELQKPKPIIFIKNYYNYEFYCPTCNRQFYHPYYSTRPKYCDNCGQAINWDAV